MNDTTPSAANLQTPEGLIQSTRSQVHAAYAQLGAARRRGDARGVITAAAQADIAIREHRRAFTAWLTRIAP